MRVLTKPRSASIISMLGAMLVAAAASSAPRAQPCQPDLTIRNADEASAVGDNVYGLDGTSQTKTQAVGTNRPAIYVLSIQNDCGVEAAFQINAPSFLFEPWSVRYFDSATGGTEVTPHLGVGWRPAPLAAGASREFRAEVTPVSVWQVGETRTVLISAGLIDTWIVLDAVVAVTKFEPQARPDLMVRNHGEASAIGDNIYNLDGAGQTKAQTVAPGGTAIYVVTIQNDDLDAGFIAVLGTAGSGGWSVRYFDSPSGGAEIFTMTTAPGLFLPPLAPGLAREFRVEVTAPFGASDGASMPILVSATSLLTMPARRDAVLAITTADVRRQPDLMIRNISEPTPVGDNVYNLDGAGQTKSQTVAPGGVASYVITNQNDGNVIDFPRIIATAGSGGWSIRYFDLTVGIDITSQITTGAGGLSLVLEPGGSREYRVEVTAPVTASPGASTRVLVAASSIGDPVPGDAVAAVTTVDVQRRPDLLIRNAYDTPVAGNDVYNDTGDNQRQSTAVAPGLSAAFVATLQNDATAADAFTLTGPAGSAGWAINYFDAAEGGSDITAQVTGAGWRTSSLAPGAALEVRVELSPAASLPGGQQIDVRVTAASTGDPAARDTVLASARTPLPLRPDLMIRLGSEAEFFFAGSNVYNITGQNQARIQAVSTGTTAAYVIALQNDADRPDRFRITGLAGRSGWTVRYFDAAGGGTDVTGPVTAAGWMSPVLAPGASIRLRVEVIAGSTVALGAQANLRIMAASAGDPARQDVVLASTRLSSLRGNTLIADAFNYRVIEVDAAKTIVWQYGTGVRGTGPNQLQGPYRARRLAGGNTLIVDFDGHRVIEVTRDRTIAWQFGKSDIAQPHLWAYPDYAERLANGNTLISSRGEGAGSYGDNTIYHRLIEVAPDKSIVWRYDYIAPTSSRPDPRPILPTSAVRLAQGKTLIMDARYGTALEVAANQKTLWYYGELNQLRAPNMATRLSNGNTLITDLYNYRVIEVNTAKAIVWQYGRTQVAGWGPNQLYAPHSAVRLANGNTLIAHGHDRVIEVNASKAIVWQYGGDALGSGPNQLHGPADAQRLGPQ